MKFCQFLFLLFSLSAAAQEMSSPLNMPLFLSGNFGELRSNHFHSGIDFKTQGTTGWPVIAVMEGYVSRVSVSPYGYGRALYISHPNGLTSVYGHLERFSSKIEAAVRDSQYRRETFTVDLQFSPTDFSVQRGETVAVSGNTGSSGGPHLHFEFRKTDSEMPIDPLPFFLSRVKDTTPPELREIKLFPLEGRGTAAGDTAWGLVGVGVKAYDRMNGTGNIYGVREIILKLDGHEIFHSVLDEFSFDETRYLNSFIDWNEWQQNRSFFMKSFIESGNRLRVYLSNSDGVVNFCDERAYNFEYTLRDAAGNSTVKHFTVEGQKMNIPQPPASAAIYYCNTDNYISTDGMALTIPKGNLYTDIRLQPSVSEGLLPFAPIYSVGAVAPLHGYCRLALKIANDMFADKSKYGIVAVSGGKMSWIGGKYSSGSIVADIRETGDFTVAVDSVAPTVEEPKQKRQSASRLSFRIEDDLSGIASWRATLDGRFVLFEYDPKRRLIFCDFDGARMKRGVQTLHLEVCDSAGNKRVVEKKISIP
jgi:hypothetical protein